MPELYEVEMQAKIIGWKTVYVEAESFEEADRKAQEFASAYRSDLWGLNDYPAEVLSSEPKKPLMPSMIESIYAEEEIIK